MPRLSRRPRLARRRQGTGPIWRARQTEVADLPRACVGALAAGRGANSLPLRVPTTPMHVASTAACAAGRLAPPGRFDLQLVRWRQAFEHDLHQITGLELGRRPDDKALG
jgi:hypothetical protein